MADDFNGAVRAYANAGKEFKSGFMERVRTYAVYLVQYIKREKLSGQVLGKYARAYDLVGGQSRWRKKPGSGKKTFGANVYNDPAIQFMSTIYLRAWEFGFHRPRYFVKPTVAKALVWWTGKGWAYSKGHWIKAQTFAAKEYIRPSIKETSDRFYVLIYRPFVRYFRGGGR